MTDTPPRLRSIAPPTRDKMIIWSALVAGCGIMALLGRYAAIYRFGTDEFTGNILFAVFFILLIGLCFSVQSLFETVFKRLFPQRIPSLVVAELPNGTHIAVPENEESSELMQFSAMAETSECEVCEEDVEFAPDTTSEEFQVMGHLDELHHIRFTDGTTAYIGEGLSEEEILAEKAYYENLDYIYDEDALIDRHTFIPHGEGCPSFEEFMTGKSVDSHLADNTDYHVGVIRFFYFNELIKSSASSLEWNLMT